MKLASSEARKATAFATSSGCPNLPSGVIWMPQSLSSWGRSAVSSVSMNPGATALTVMLRPPTSLARALVRPMRPALEDE